MYENKPQFKYEWDDECDCNTIIYSSLIERLEEQLEHNNGFAKEEARNALKFIVWQKAEIENLKAELKAMRGAANSYKIAYEQETPYAIQVEVSDKIEKKIKSEVIKAFAERLKIKVKMYNSEDVDEGDLIDDLLTVSETVEIIDSLAKEMMEV